MAQRKLDPAITAFETAIRLRPDFVPPYVNSAFVYNAQGNNVKAEQSFRKALALDPNNVVTLTNLAMLLGEMGRTREMETTFRQVLSHDPNSATASYNLGVLLADSKPVEALAWCKRAYELRQHDSKYAYTYAYYLHQQGHALEAVGVLQKAVDNQTASADAYMLLGNLLETLGDLTRARQVYRQGAQNPALPQQVRQYFQMQVQRLGG
jgi:Flp pilus assembly protein TadD